MLSDKIKIRISDFVSLIIDNDAQLWGFVKSDDSSNRNAFLNKLIPNMLAMRKARREEIKNILEIDYQRKDAEKIYECVNTVIDEVYFRDEELDVLSEDIWIRPTKESLAAFDEIETEELDICALDMTSYIRGLLNEYARLPQYKRQDVLFKREIDLLEEACASGRVLCFRYEGKRVKVYAYWKIYQYTLEQRSYLVAYNFETKEISSFFIEKIENPYLLKRKFSPPQRLLEILIDYCENEKYDEYTVLTYGENQNEK